MASHQTGIQWTHRPGTIGVTWNPTVGCARVSPGCDNCYAFTLHNQRYGANVRAALPDPQDGDLAAFRKKVGVGRDWTWPQAAREGAAQSGQDHGLPLPAQYDVPFSRVQLLGDDRLLEPLHWRKPRTAFVDSMADLFHEAVPDAFIDRVFAVMALAQDHVFQVLTKRPERMRAYVRGWTEQRVPYEEATFARATIALESVGAYGDATIHTPWPLPNVWLGVSVENEQAARERVGVLVDTPAAVHFLSMEPLLEHVALTALDCWRNPDGLDGESWLQEPVQPGHMAGLDWVIVGGESGPRARPMNLAWARSIVEQCRAAGVPVFVKQLGSKPIRGHGLDCADHEHAEVRLRSQHGSDIDEWPEDLRVREWPA